MWTQHPNFADARVRYLENDGELVRHVQQDAAPIMDANKRLANETGGWNSSRSMKKVASVPATLWYSWIVDWQRRGLLPDMSHPQFSEMANALCVKRVKDGDWSRFSV